jgi:hypothetical protein
MNIIFLNLITFFLFVNSKNCYYTLKNTGLRYLILENKNTYNFIKNLTKNTKKYYLKAFGTMCEGMEKYKTLPEDDKILIEAIISLCF